MSSMAPSPPMARIGGTQAEFLVGELLPVERPRAPARAPRRRTSAVAQRFRPAHRRRTRPPSSACAPRTRRSRSTGVLEQMVHPGERIRIVRIRAGPDRGASGAVRHARWRAALAARSLDVAPAQLLELACTLVVSRARPLAPLLRRRAATSRRFGGRRRAVEIGVRGQQLPRLACRAARSARRARRTCAATRGRMSASMVETTRCTAVFSPQPMHAPSPPDHRAVAALLEQERRQHADALVHVADVDEPVGGVRQPLPERPVGAELRQIGSSCRTVVERAVGADGRRRGCSPCRPRD